MRQVVWGDIERLRDGFPGKGSGVVFVNIDPNRFKQSLTAGGGLDLTPRRSTQWLSRLAIISLAVCCSCGCICISWSVCKSSDPIRGPRRATCCFARFRTSLPSQCKRLNPSCCLPNRILSVVAGACQCGLFQPPAGTYKHPPAVNAASLVFH